MASSSSSSKPDTIVGTQLEEGQFVVERVLKKRMVAGRQAEFLLKWMGFGEEDNTWEPEENLNPALVRAFQRHEEAKAKKKTEAASNSNSVGKNGSRPGQVSKKKKEKTATKVTGGESFPFAEKEHEVATGFDRELVAERILGCTESGSQRLFLIKWKETNESELVTVANEQCPQLVIKFYEERLIWGKTKSSNA